MTFFEVTGKNLTIFNCLVNPNALRHPCQSGCRGNFRALPGRCVQIVPEHNTFLLFSLLIHFPLNHHACQRSQQAANRCPDSGGHRCADDGAGHLTDLSRRHAAAPGYRRQKNRCEQDLLSVHPTENRIARMLLRA